MTINYHGWTHRPKVQGGSDPIDYVVLKIKLTGDRADDDPPVADARAFTVPVDNDMHGLRLKNAFVQVGTVSSSGGVTISIENETQAVTLMSTDGPGASTFIKDCTASLAANPDNIVQMDDILVIAIISGGTDARGLGCTLEFY